MAQNDKAVVTAAQGFVFVAPVGTAPPTPTELDSVDPAIFGAEVRTVTVTGAPTSLVLTVGASSTPPLPIGATPAQVQSALEALSTVGSGNVLVTGTSFTAGLDIAWVGALQGTTLVVSGGTFVGGTAPAANVVVKTALNGWVTTGHTSRDDMPEFGFDGGDAEVKGTWQNAALREVVTEQAADYVTVVLQQFDKGSFELYYGPNSVTAPAGVFGVDGGAAATNEKAFLVIIVDGTTRIGFYAAKASIRRDDSISLPVDEFAGLPIRATFLKHGASRLFDWISKDLFGS